MIHNIIFKKEDEQEAITVIENHFKDGYLLLADTGYLPNGERAVIVEKK